MDILLGIIGTCLAALTVIFFLQAVLPRFRTTYYVRSQSGVTVGPFYSQGAAKRYAQGHGLAGMDPAMWAGRGQVVRREP